MQGRPLRIAKVANVSNTLDTGMARAMRFSAEALEQLGYSVDVVFAEDVAHPFAGKFDRLTFPLALIATLTERHRTQPYDVVELHEPLAAAYCWKRRRRHGLPPCVLMSHGLEERSWQAHLELHRLIGRPISPLCQHRLRQSW